MLVCSAKGAPNQMAEALGDIAKSTARGRAMGIVANQPVISETAEGVSRVAIKRWPQVIVAVAHRVMETPVFATSD